MYILTVANWKKLISRATTYKERQRGVAGSARESSPIPGVELFDLTEGSQKLCTLFSKLYIKITWLLFRCGSQHWTYFNFTRICLACR